VSITTLERRESAMKKVVSFVLSTVPCVVAVSVTCSMGSLLARQLQTDRDPARGEQKNLELLGTNDLQCALGISAGRAASR